MAKSGKHPIPAEVIRIQKEYGCNHSEYVATIENEDVYSLSRLDENGFPLPIGLPIFVLVKGDDCRVVDGNEGFELMDSLPEDE